MDSVLLILSVASAVVTVVGAVAGLFNYYTSRAIVRALNEKRLSDIEGRLSSLPCSDHAAQLARLDERTRRGGHK